MTTKRSKRRKHGSWLEFLDAHRLKATLGSIAATIGLLVSMGFIDTAKLPPWAIQLLPQLGLAPVSAPSSSPTTIVNAAAGATIQTCFTPGEDCSTLIASKVASAKTELLVQAYGFTAPEIANSIIGAHKRGVKVTVVLDKSNEVSRDTAADLLVANGIQPRIDSSVTIAHNKVMIIDQDTVITGSFNFTESAQKRNAENVLIVSGDPTLAAQYRRNFEKRLTASRRYLGFIAPYM